MQKNFNFVFKIWNNIKEFHIKNNFYNFLGKGASNPVPRSKIFKKTYITNDRKYNFVSFKNGKTAIGVIDNYGISVYKAENKKIKVYYKLYTHKPITYYDNTVHF